MHADPPWRVRGPHTPCAMATRLPDSLLEMVGGGGGRNRRKKKKKPKKLNRKEQRAQDRAAKKANVARPIHPMFHIRTLCARNPNH